MLRASPRVVPSGRRQEAVSCRLGCGGIESILELTLTDKEREGLHTSARTVRQNIERSQEVLANKIIRNL